MSALKETLYASEQNRIDVARARRRWIRQQRLLDSTALVFLDETAITTSMVRTRGRCTRGDRLVDYAPHGHWTTISFIAGLRHDKMVAPFAIEGAMNGDIFLAYIEQCLAPTLKPGDIVIMDNVATHKVNGVAEAIEAVGATVRYLPQYSPDLNPIEQAFSKLKALLRKAAERTVPTLRKARQTPRQLHRCRLRQFPPTLRLWFDLSGIRSSSTSRIPPYPDTGRGPRLAR